jgi:hypothetical protein
VTTAYEDPPAAAAAAAADRTPLPSTAPPAPLPSAAPAAPGTSASTSASSKADLIKAILRASRQGHAAGSAAAGGSAAGGGAAGHKHSTSWSESSHTAAAASKPEVSSPVIVAGMAPSLPRQDYMVHSASMPPERRAASAARGSQPEASGELAASADCR